MSGLEVAGVVLGALPLIISGLEHWRKVAEIGGFFWRIRKEYTKCKNDVKYHDIMYRRNLKALLLPLINEPKEVEYLIRTPGGKGWTDKVMQERLEERLKDSYDLYLDIIHDLNETAQALRKELSFNDTSIQDKLTIPPTKSQQRPPSPLPSGTQTKSLVRAKWDYEKFRMRFSLNESVRTGLVQQLEKCNERLRQLLTTSDEISALAESGPVNKQKNLALEDALKKSRRRCKLLFMAIQGAWQCLCQPCHYAHLRLEHRTRPDTSFELILTYAMDPSVRPTSWSWRELQCGPALECCGRRIANMAKNEVPVVTLTDPPPSAIAKKSKTVTFAPLNSNSPIREGLNMKRNIELCQTLGSTNCSKCLGILSKDDEEYHVHSSRKRKRPSMGISPSLDSVIADRSLSRRERYSVALLLASSVAQLQETPWLDTRLKKEDILFHPYEDDGSNSPIHELFIRQGFSQPDPNSRTNKDDCNFYSLGILLLELCFAQRLEDHPYRKAYPAATGETKEAFDLVAALRWSHDVRDEGGHEYASAVSWCFTTARDPTQVWQSAIIKNVIRPLELCQEHFKTATVDG
ncbi:hypothetical protein BU25DRAFT_487328 [Macroventuria anomochaeta]|uniref:Uncharacterized protein n=1 Tax=Macroventuria anomochaeta TaxID=301207 RepID=A0ACB6SI28_9PLEO|nr:uncharacterized protein BU25DRAFT_487328 [Macroventuria anomochaeta]KAF2632934.1 hypothetical protein BU25DRAFT_487328 [Macroventuria anomochaeta]